jgi:hypothetical protein
VKSAIGLLILSVINFLLQAVISNMKMTCNCPMISAIGTLILSVINFFLQAVISNMKVTCKCPVRC